MKISLILAVLVFAATATAYEGRVTKGQLSPDLQSMLAKAEADTGVAFDAENFMLIEDRKMATSHFKFYVQTNSMVPVAKTAIRIWSDLQTNELILGELHLDTNVVIFQDIFDAKFKNAKFSVSALKSKQLAQAVSRMVTSEVENHSTDARVISLKSKDQWENGDLVRVVEVRARRGIHTVTVSLLKNKIIRSTYSEFPQSESVSLKANIFPIYEEAEGSGEKLPYEVKELRYIDTNIYDAGSNPIGPFQGTSFPESNYYPLLAETSLGEAYGFWSEASLRKKIEALTSTLPLRSNSFSSGLLLQGKFATINIHPDAKEAFKDVTFDLVPTTNSMIAWNLVDGAYRGFPKVGLAGKPILSQEELLSRIPFRHPENDPTYYINSGVDEAQVYYAVTVLMENLAEMGFTDKELSEKPFHAFLYDPDIGMQDNAYYTNDTINFTTYTKESQNLARDNSTIWHELGHGVMDRLMGQHLGFSTGGGYGGLSEGMADFIASIIVEAQTNGVPFPGKNKFRILNQTGYYLTNELHDEGEAYGGVMNDILLKAIKEEGRAGLVAITDLTLEAMRLTRNHPSLSAAGWFDHMLYADSLGSSVRAAGKYKNSIESALSSRNFSFDPGFSPAQMNLSFSNVNAPNGTQVLTENSLGSRNKPVELCKQNADSASFDLKLKLTAGDSNFIKFPATVKVEYKSGALQGAINWEGEINNPETYVINSAAETLAIPLKVSLECDSINQPDGSCKDYAYVQVWNEGSKPIAKKRFYLKINPTCKASKR